MEETLYAIKDKGTKWVWSAQNNNEWVDSLAHATLFQDKLVAQAVANTLNVSWKPILVKVTIKVEED